MAREKADEGEFTAALTSFSKNVCNSERKQDCAQVGAKSFAMKSLAELVLEHRKSLGMNATEYARHVGTSRQNINNVEADEARQPRYIGKLAKAMGVSVDALLSGHAGPWAVVGAPEQKSTPAERAPPSGGAQVRGGLAQDMSSLRGTMAPTTISWESIMAIKLPAEFALVISDDSMASKYPKGSTVEFSTVEGDPRAGDAVLVADADDNVFFRQYQQRRPGHWQAVALNQSYQPLDSKEDGLRVLAIKVASRGRDG